MIRKLRNLGPQSEAMLAKAGVFTVEQLLRVGSVQAFLAVKRLGGKPSLNLLWAIEGALSDRSWQDVAKNDRLSLLLKLEAETARERNNV